MVFDIASPGNTHLKLHVSMANKIGIYRTNNFGDMVKIAQLMRGWVNTYHPFGTAIFFIWTIGLTGS